MKQIIIEMRKMILRPQEKGQKTAESGCSIYERKMQLYFFLKKKKSQNQLHTGSLTTGYEHCRRLRKIRSQDGSPGPDSLFPLHLSASPKGFICVGLALREPRVTCFVLCCPTGLKTSRFSLHSFKTTQKAKFILLLHGELHLALNNRFHGL